MNSVSVFFLLVEVCRVLCSKYFQHQLILINWLCNKTMNGVCIVSVTKYLKLWLALVSNSSFVVFIFYTKHKSNKINKNLNILQITAFNKNKFI